MFHAFLKNLELRYHQLKSRFFPRKPLAISIDVKEISSSINEDQLNISQMENSELSVKSSLSKLNENLELLRERVLKLETTIEESLVLKLNK